MVWDRSVSRVGPTAAWNPYTTVGRGIHGDVRGGAGRGDGSRKSRKKEGGIKGPQARAGGSSGSPLAPLLFKPPKKHREGPGKGANKQNSKKRKLQEYGEMRTSEAFSSGCCSSIGYLGIFAKERRPQRSLRPPRPSDRALSVSLLRMRLLQA